MKGVLAKSGVVLNQFKSVLRILLVFRGGIGAFPVLSANQSDNFSILSLLCHYLPSCLPYRLRNFSTRPAESTNFWVPVKKGWQFEQISTCISGTFERISVTGPLGVQGQMTLHATKFGWVSAFMVKPRSTLRIAIMTDLDSSRQEELAGTRNL